MEEMPRNERRSASRRHMGAFVVGLMVVVLLGVGYYYTSGQKTEADVVTVAVRGSLSVEQKDGLSRQLSGYAPEDGEGVALSLYEFPADGGGETPQMLEDLLETLDFGPSDLLIADSYVYDLLDGGAQFEDLSLRYPGDPAVKERYCYAVNGKPFANAVGLEKLPELYLALRSSESDIVAKNAQTLERYDYERELLDNIVYSTPPEGFAEANL